METSARKTKRKRRALLVPPILVSATGAAAALGISRAHFQNLYKQGHIGPLGIKLGGRRLWNLDELRRWADAVERGDLPNRVEWEEMERARRRRVGHAVGHHG